MKTQPVLKCNQLMYFQTLDYDLIYIDFATGLDYTYITDQDEDKKLTLLVLRKDDEKKIKKKVNPIPRYHMTRKITLKEEVIQGIHCIVIKCSSLHFLRKKSL